MDIQRPSNARAKKIRRIAYGTVAIILMAGVTYGLSRLRPAAPTVDRATISRGPYDQGLITVEDYWLDFARRAGVRIDPRLIGRLRRWDTEMWSRINPHMTKWLQMLHRGGFTTALLSNMETDMVAYVRKNFSWLAYFHHQIFSCEVGLIKPDSAIFHRCIQRIGVRPQEALFVDDRQENVKAARITGITAIQFQSVKQLRTDLKEMGFKILPRANELKEPA